MSVQAVTKTTPEDGGQHPVFFFFLIVHYLVFNKNVWSIQKTGRTYDL